MSLRNHEEGSRKNPLWFHKDSFSERFLNGPFWRTFKKSKETFSTIKNLCGTKTCSSMASLQKHLCEAFIFKSVLIVKMAYCEKYNFLRHKVYSICIKLALIISGAHPVKKLCAIHNSWSFLWISVCKTRWGLDDPEAGPWHQLESERRARESVSSKDVHFKSLNNSKAAHIRVCDEFTELVTPDKSCYVAQLTWSYLLNKSLSFRFHRSKCLNHRMTSS